MMFWLLLTLGLLFVMLGTALMHQPGVRVYDWIATRARRPRPAAKPVVHTEERQPLTQTV
ncbi:hypothetical protein [Achromobacter sp.]|uniref:hypothetical protein n=1 Tax=Achromobacter sp. TaxID=134375 RepID=UPI0028B09CFF|nr:hypothetical protein [Achromobacter sp.]